MRLAIITLACLLAAAGAAPAAENGADLVPLRVQRVVLVNHSPAVLLLDEARKRYLLMFVDVFMATAIRMGMDGAHFERPMTHDLIGTLLHRAGVRLTRITITELRNNTYYALIGLQINGKETTVDSRPSDALALAVREGVPILGAANLLKPLKDAPEHPDAPEDAAPQDGPGRQEI